MADTEQKARVIPPEVMALHYQDKANALEGMAVTRLADKIARDIDVAHLDALVAKLQQELQAANEKIATLEAGKGK